MYGMSQTQCGSVSRPTNQAGHKFSRQSPAARQAGRTTVGLIVLIVFIALMAFATLRLAPVYLNYMKIVGVVDGVFDEFDAQNPTRVALRGSIARRIDIDSVSVITARDVKVTPVKTGFQVAVIYDHTSPFIGNVSFVVHFEKTVIVRH
jgi:hypothetical protein